MTVDEAFQQLTESAEFKEAAKKQAKYRVYLGRFKEGKLGLGAMAEILVQHGYEVKANKAKRKDN